MRRIRIGLLSFALIALVMGHGMTAFGLTAEDEAFLQKKIIARWNITGKKQIEAAYARGVDILEDHPNPANGYFTVFVSTDELDALRADGYSLDVIHHDWYKDYAALNAKTMGGFVTWIEALGIMDSLHTAFPTLTSEMTSLGQTLGGNDLWAMKISDNPEIDENEPEILFTGLHHAREPITIEINLHTMRTLLFNYGSDADITALVNEREIWFVPIVNPDGYLFNELDEPLGGGFWRKNRKLNAGGSRGVDNNRNYGDHWGYDNIGSSGNGNSETYRGTAAFSELENQHIRDFVQSRDFVIAVNFHSFSNLFLWAPGWADFYTADELMFRAIGDSVTSHNGYTAAPGWGLYNTNGDADDWYYFAEGVLSFTPEVGSQADGFWPNPSRIPALVNENIPGNLFLIGLADNPQRMTPPVKPTWIAPGTVNVSDYDLEWSDPGGQNGAVSYELKEFFGRSVSTDLTNNADNWHSDGFVLSSSQVYSGTQSFWGGTGNGISSHLQSKQYYKPLPNDTLRARIWYDTEVNYDYAYVEVSADFGLSWATLPGNVTTNLNPNNTNRGNGITGSSLDAFVEGKFPLNSYVGDDILIRLSYETDGGVLGDGVYFDNIYPVVAYDSIVVLDPATANTTFPVTGKDPGSYFYTLNSTDQHGQESEDTPPHEVVVDYVTCDCSCHADPVCEGNTDVLDVVETVAVAFRNDPEEFDTMCPHNPGGRTDVDCSAATDVIDVVKVVGVAFRNESTAANFCDPCAP